MKITKAIASIYMKFSRWTFVHEELPPKVVAIGAPHTSNFDAFLMVMAFWKVGRPIKFLVKDSAAHAPVLGRLVRALGGISIDRSAHHGMVGSLVHQAEAADTFTLIIAPKGTRSPREYWKSGFYRICLETGMPIQLGFIDRTTMTYGWGGIVRVTGDVKADMDRIRAFYKGKTGFKPAKVSEPRLRAEDDEAARSWLLEGWEK
ncbi:1-acyl-sn-glycerol-3-phosphate acyltransferase [Arcanobacterium haemolyticum]|nr:1-acyl-sn-glycerol-3-phosphate acyltransferase [Arcanobacterium haemolyticum]